MEIRIYTEETVPKEIKKFCEWDTETPDRRFIKHGEYYYHAINTSKSMLFAFCIAIEQARINLELGSKMNKK